MPIPKDGRPSQSPTQRKNEGVQSKQPTKRVLKRSLNRGGRQKGAKNRKTIVRLVADEMHTVKEGGKRRRRTTLELVIIKLRNMALEGGNIGALDEMHRLLKTVEPQDPDHNRGYVVLPADMPAEEWAAKQMKLNETRKPPPGFSQVNR